MVGISYRRRGIGLSGSPWHPRPESQRRKRPFGGARNWPGVMREDMQIRRGESGVPFSEITGREIERTLGRTLQEKATNWMRLNLQGKSFENDATGWDIAVGRKGINKAMSHGARDVHARSVAAIPDLLKHAILVASEENRDAIERESVPRVHHFYARCASTAPNTSPAWLSKRPRTARDSTITTRRMR